MSVSNIEDRSCERYRQHIDAYLDEELESETRHDVQQHLASCPKCSRILENRGRMKQLVQHAVGREEAPTELVNAIRSGISAKSRSAFAANFSGFNGWLAAAAAAVLLTAGTVSIMRWDRQGQPRTGGNIFQTVSLGVKEILRVGLVDHIHCTIVLERWKKIVSFDEMKSAEGAAALGPEFIDLVPEVAAKLGSDYRIVGGHHCTVDGRRYVHLIMTGSRGSILSLVITEKKSGETFTNGGLKASGVDVYQDQEEAQSIVGFESEKYLAFVISNLDRDANLKLASGLVPVVYGHLHKLEL